MSDRPLLLTGATVLTMNGQAEVHRPGQVFIKNGRISAVGASVDIDETTDSIDLTGCYLLPGLVQAHVHLGQTIFRGLGERRPLLAWLRERIWPLEAAHDEDSAYWSAHLGAAECLLGGTTTVQEIGLGPGARGLLDGILESGLRAQAGLCLMDEGAGLPPVLSQSTDRALRETVELGDRFDGAGNGRMRYALNPRFILSGSDALWNGVRELALERGWPVHTHALEQEEESEAVRSVKRGRDEIEYFDECGVLDTDLRIAHGVCLTEAHLNAVVGHRFSVAHCPSANLKLGSGIADIVRIRAAGVPVGVGADGAACNNDLDAFQEMRLAALLQQVKNGPASFSGLDALRLATSEGATSIGLGEEIGSIEGGKQADLVVLEMRGPNGLADERIDPHDLIVYSGARSTVRHVMVAGQWVVRDGRLRTMDVDRIVRRAEAAVGAVLRRAGLD
jgi:cytosine/adenosine deaminase-related metal-dependent hydrolase